MFYADLAQSRFCSTLSWPSQDCCADLVNSFLADDQTLDHKPKFLHCTLHRPWPGRLLEHRLIRQGKSSLPERPRPRRSGSPSVLNTQTDSDSEQKEDGLDLVSSGSKLTHANSHKDNGSNSVSTILSFVVAVWCLAARIFSVRLVVRLYLSQLEITLLLLFDLYPLRHPHLLRFLPVRNVMCYWKYF